MNAKLKNELWQLINAAAKNLTNDGSRRRRITYLMERATIERARQIRSYINYKATQLQVAGQYDDADNVLELLSAADDVLSERACN